MWVPPFPGGLKLRSSVCHAREVDTAGPFLMEKLKWESNFEGQCAPERGFNSAAGPMSGPVAVGPAQQRQRTPWQKPRNTRLRADCTHERERNESTRISKGSEPTAQSAAPIAQRAPTSEGRTRHSRHSARAFSLPLSFFLFEFQFFSSFCNPGEAVAGSSWSPVVPRAHSVPTLYVLILRLLNQRSSQAGSLGAGEGARTRASQRPSHCTGHCEASARPVRSPSSPGSPHRKATDRCGGPQDPRRETSKASPTRDRRAS